MVVAPRGMCQPDKWLLEKKGEFLTSWESHWAHDGIDHYLPQGTVDFPQDVVLSLTSPYGLQDIYGKGSVAKLKQ